SEVLGTVDRANKEVAIEALLNTFEEVWLSRQLELVATRRQPLTISRQETVTELGLEGQIIAPATSKPRVSSAKVTSLLQRSRRSVTKPTSPTPFSPPSPSSPPDTSHQTVRLLCNTDSIFETLESHQTSIQSVIGTTAAASFTDDLHRWQKMLQTIEAVLGVWLQVQALWTQLEVYQSSEVQTHLPAQSFTFSSVDKDWRDLIQSATANPSVMTVCLKEGLLCQLEKLQTSLLQCRAALVGYAKGQRDKCHWFHFIPLDDVLKFVCCGSHVEQLSSLIHKLLPHASGLLY
ncbi:Dynein heavy chain 9, axonemal, partial [Geodia barretti]